MLSTALDLLATGFAIHWLRPRRKNPIVKNWSSRPVPTEDELRAQYRDGYNVGVRLGQPSQVGDAYLHALDIDVRDPGAWQAAYAAAQDLLGPLDDFPTVASGSGGRSRHVYFLAPEPLASRKLATSAERFTDSSDVTHYVWEVELMGTGRQVVLPPSIHPDTGAPYRWINEPDLDLMALGLGPVISDDRVALIKEKSPHGGHDSSDPLENLKPPMGVSINDARLYLRQLPEAFVDDYERWTMVGMALHHEFQGSQDGFELWDEWSQTSAKYDSEALTYRWERFGQGSNPVGFPSVVFHAGGQLDGFRLAMTDVEEARDYSTAVASVARFTLMSAELTRVVQAIQSAETARGAAKPATADVKKDIKDAHQKLMREQGSRLADDLETWLGREMLARFYARGTHLIYQAKQFWVYHHGVWRQHDDDMVRARVYRLIQAVRDNEEGGHSRLLATLAESGRDRTVSSLTESVFNVVCRQLTLDSADDPLRLNDTTLPSVMNCRNVELWFEGGGVDVREHDPSNRFTMQLACEFDAGATCPQWDAALEQIFGEHEDRDDVIRHFHEVCGYLMQLSRSFAHWILFHGSGSNGKSFVTGILQHLLGDSVASISLADFDERGNNHAVAGLVGRLLVVDDDFRYGAFLPDSTLKKLSESKPLTANPKFKPEFNFVSRATPLILSNHLPGARDMSYGLLRRALVFDFNHLIREDEKDTGLAGRIIADELPGVLNRLIAGWQRLQRRGRVEVPVSCERAVAAWQSESNVYGQFAAECLEVTGDAADQVEASRLWELFNAWRSTAGLDNLGTIGRNRFYSNLSSINGISMRVFGVRKSKNAFGVRLIEGVEDVHL